MASFVAQSTDFRANVTRKASMIFDGVPSVGQLPASFNMHNLSTRRNAGLFTAVANQTRPTILARKGSAASRNSQSR